MVVKKVVKKYISYFKVALVRGFVPLNTLGFVMLFKGAVHVKDFSFYIALVQVLSNIDFGINAKVLSTPRVGSLGKLYSYYNYYIREYILVKVLFVSLACAIYFIVFNKSVEWVVLFAFFTSELVVIYNLCSNTSISEGNYNLIVRFIFFTCIFQLFSMVIVVIREVAFSNDVAMSIYSLSFLFGVLCVAHQIYLGRCASERVNMSTNFMWRLQVSQLSSSLILNKDFILLYLFSYSNQAAIYATAARVMLIPIQFNSVIISKLWVDIANSKLELKKFIANARTLVFVSSVSTIIPMFFCYYTLHEKADYIIILLLLLLLFIICNACSALSSAYATVDGNAIPSIYWYVASTVFVVFMSGFFYLIGWWLISILISCIYFLFLGRRNFKAIKWM